MWCLLLLLTDLEITSNCGFTFKDEKTWLNASGFLRLFIHCFCEANVTAIYLPSLDYMVSLKVYFHHRFKQTMNLFCRFLHLHECTSKVFPIKFLVYELSTTIACMAFLLCAVITMNLARNLYKWDCSIVIYRTIMANSMTCTVINKIDYWNIALNRRDFS